jgi:hypothetical protein
MVGDDACKLYFFGICGRHLHEEGASAVSCCECLLWVVSWCNSLYLKFAPLLLGGHALYFELCLLFCVSCFAL